MKAFLLVLMLLGSLGSAARAQSAQEMQSAAPERRAGESEEQHGKRLLEEMVQALGGDAWLNKRTEYIEGQTAPFFKGEPSGGVARFVAFRKFAQGGQPDLERIEFVSYRGMIAPGTVRNVAHLWTADNGYEFTYKGRTTLPERQVQDYLRRRAHSLEAVMRSWIKQPGVMIVYAGQGTRDRRPIDKVSVLTANNDAVTIELEQSTHLPLQRSFEWRNEQFKDHDLDEEVYGDWREFDGVQTPMNVTTYRNGDMASQTFYKKVRFNQPVDDGLFDKDRPLKK